MRKTSGISTLIDGPGRVLIIPMIRSVADTITVLTNALADDFHVMPQQIPGAPIFMAVALPKWDGVTGLKPRLPSGRGVTLQNTLLTAAAEALELRSSLAQNHPDVILGSDRHDGLAMVVAHDLASGELVQVTAQSVYLDFAALNGELLLADADSTGCATGVDRDDAINRAMLECIERDAVALWWYGEKQCPAVAIDVIDRWQPRLCWWLLGRRRQTRLIDLTTDIGIPVVVAFSCFENGSAIAMGSAARPSQADAALAAITEMIQTETAMTQAIAAADPGLIDWIARASIQTLRQFQPLAPKPPAVKPNFAPQMILQNLAATGHRALVVDLTLPTDPLPSVRVMVPGLCAMGGRIDAPRFERLTGKPFADLRLGADDLFEPF